MKAEGKWLEPKGQLRDIPADVGTYQDDVFMWTDSAEVLSKNIALLSAELRKVGLHLAANKTHVVASSYYKGRRVVSFDGNHIHLQPVGTPVRVLGLDYDFDASPSQQAHELHGRVWSAFHEHKHLLCGPGTYACKYKLVQMLVEGVWSWSAGAVHWETADLQMMNSTQLRVLRLAFGVKRKRDEDWVAYNSRSLRFVRQWIATSGAERWSSKILRLQFQVVGHWFRQFEGEVRGLAARIQLWRCMQWWNSEKKLSNGVRHPRRFRAANLERSLATCLGDQWFLACANREGWKQLLRKWLQDMDVPWTKGRQLCLCE